MNLNKKSDHLDLLEKKKTEKAFRFNFLEVTLLTVKLLDTVKK